MSPPLPGCSVDEAAAGAAPAEAGELCSSGRASSSGGGITRAGMFDGGVLPAALSCPSRSVCICDRAWCVSAALFASAKAWKLCSPRRRSASASCRRDTAAAPAFAAPLVLLSTRSSYASTMSRMSSSMSFENAACGTRPACRTCPACPASPGGARWTPFCNEVADSRCWRAPAMSRDCGNICCARIGCPATDPESTCCTMSCVAMGLTSASMRTPFVPTRCCSITWRAPRDGSWPTRSGFGSAA